MNTEFFHNNKTYILLETSSKGMKKFAGSRMIVDYCKHFDFLGTCAGTVVATTEGDTERGFWTSTVKDIKTDGDVITVTTQNSIYKFKEVE